LTNAPEDTLVVIIATSRYPNELIKLAKVARRLGHRLLVIADSVLCPLNQFAHLQLVAPTINIPFIGSPTSIFSLINYLVLEIAARNGHQLMEHQETLEQIYRENDVLFNLYNQDTGMT
jgi:DNA-binding MurR/RpiR family transcriptional regulator